MRIREFSVAELFGIFHHHVPLNLEDRITIVHGPNGFGKTVLLGMLDGLFNARYALFRRVPFRQFHVTLEDGRELRVDRFCPEGDEDRILIHGPGADQTFDITSPTIPGASCEPGETPQVREVGEPAPPAWLADLQRAVPVSFVRTDRLSTSPGTPSPAASAVTAYSRDLTREIERALARSVEISARLDASFPERLLSSLQEPAPPEAELRERLERLHAKRRRLAKAGLLEGDEGEVPGGRLGDAALPALAVHARDAWAKLQVFDGLLHRIELLKELVNARFLYKRLSVDRDQGFVFTAAGARRLPPEALSSGEGHQLALLYELLFKVQAGSLILIDEPELSLHIAWQQEFLGDLSRVTALSGFDVVLATHSPDIVSDRWDLTVELKGPESLV